MFKLLHPAVGRNVTFFDILVNSISGLAGLATKKVGNRQEKWTQVGVETGPT